MIPQLHIAPDELLPGSTLGKYEILRKLATGGMAEIYLARARGAAGFEKTVVLKRILPHVAEDETFVHMFLDEARLAATLQHPNIADVYDVGDADGNPFFTMEYVHGQDVRAIRAATRKREEQVPIAMALAIVHGTASALDYAHERIGPDGKPLELVHRDVSSSNVIVSYDGAIKLLDFGIARAASHQHKTQIGTLKGKTPYMSPEQCRAQRLDRRSDLFSLGTVMFELTVGRRPFRGENDFAVMEQIVHGEAPRPSTLVRGYPGELEAIVMKLLAREVDARYQTAEELLHDLEAFISQHGLWVSSRPLGKYMRLLFAERIEAWERAANEGVTLSEHVAETITSESQRDALLTPQSAAPRLRRLSQEYPAVGLPSRQMPAVLPPAAEDRTVSAAPVSIAAPESAPVAMFAAVPMPTLTPISMPVPVPTPGAMPSSAAVPPEPGDDAYRIPSPRRGLILAVAGLIVGTVALVVYAWPVVFPARAPAASKAAAPAAGDDRPSPAPAAPVRVEPAPSATAPAGAPASGASSAPTAPSGEPTTSAGGAAPAPANGPDAPETTPAPAETAPAKRPGGKRTSPRLPGKAPSRVPSSKQPAEDAWDRDSPFLPPST